MSIETGQQASDRRRLWQPPARPEWLATVNRLGEQLDARSVVPLDEQSLLDAARRNTGLDDFDEDGWRDHFRVLLSAIENEAKLNFYGRVLTRSDLLIYLEARLRITEEYRRHPEIDDEQIVEPVFILGLGRSGTSILHQTLSNDPQFRSVRKWESLFPVPAPEEATYESDPRIARAGKLGDIIDTMSPEWHAIHPAGAELPVEDIEFTYLAFFSEVWCNAFQIPSYDRYFRNQSAAYHFYWHKRMLKLLQWKFRRPHWLLKNPTHMERVSMLLDTYPDAKIILPHRDPVVTADSVVNASGTIFYWRTDHPYCYDESASAWADIEPRIKMWDDVIGLIESGKMRPGYFANVIYADFMRAPRTQIEKIYRDLELTLTAAALDSMLNMLNGRHGSGHGNAAKYEKSRGSDPRTLEERRRYQRYQQYFGVPDET